MWIDFQFKHSRICYLASVWGCLSSSIAWQKEVKYIIGQQLLEVSRQKSLLFTLSITRPDLRAGDLTLPTKKVICDTS